MKYLVGTIDLGIRLTKGDLTLVGYADASFENDPLTNNSVGGFIIFLGDNPISWGVRKNRNKPSLSTLDAESSAAVEAAREIDWLRLAVDNYGIPQTQRTTLFEDNQPLIDLTRNRAFHKRSKHIAVRLNYLRAAGDPTEGFLEFKKIDTKDTPADALTKALARSVFDRHRAKILNLKPKSENNDSNAKKTKKAPDSRKDSAPRLPLLTQDFYPALTENSKQ